MGHDTQRLHQKHLETRTNSACNTYCNTHTHSSVNRKVTLPSSPQPAHTLRHTMLYTHPSTPCFTHTHKLRFFCKNSHRCVCVHVCVRVCVCVCLFLLGHLSELPARHVHAEVVEPVARVVLSAALREARLGAGEAEVAPSRLSCLVQDACSVAGVIGCHPLEAADLHNAPIKLTANEWLGVRQIKVQECMLSCTLCSTTYVSSSH